MAHLAEADTNVFNYTGGVIPEDQRSQIIHVEVDESISVIEDEAFMYCESLLSIQFHNGVVEIGKEAFFGCRSLQKINLPRVKTIRTSAFHGCEQLTDVDIGDKLETIGDGAFSECFSLVDVDFGNKLETIGDNAFSFCHSLTSVNIPPSVTSIEYRAFAECQNLTVMEFDEGIETINAGAFDFCDSLKQIVIPAKQGLFLPDSDGHVFRFCDNLTTVKVVGGIHKTIASLHLEKWKKETVEEIERINQVLPKTLTRDMTRAIVNWMEGVLARITYYKREHSKMVTEAMDIVDGVVWEVQDNERNASWLNEEGEPEKKKRCIMSQPDEDGTRGDVWGMKHDITGHMFSYLQPN